MAERVRFGLLGCGVIGAAHAAALAGLPDAQLVAVADVDAARAATLGTQYAVPAYADLAALLGAPVDVVDICTPSGLHGMQAVAAMRAGRHVLVEKPMDIRREALDAMLAAQAAAGVKLAVISQHRFDASAQRVRALLDGGALGRLVLGNVQLAWWRSQAYYDSAAWRGTLALDGGVLMNQGIHAIDLLQWFMGPVRSVTAYTGTFAHRMEAEDTAVAALGFQSGALGSIVATTGAYPGDTTRVEVFGDRGAAIIENDQLPYLRLAGADPSADAGSVPAASAAAGSGALGATAPLPPLNSHARQIADLIRAIREDGTPLVDGHAARRPVEIILAIYESARSGREVLLS